MSTQVYINGFPLTWPQRILVGLVALVVVLLGLAFGAAILGLGAIAALIVMARLWWLRRRLRREGTRAGVTVVEGEYQVLERHIDGHRRGE